MSLKDLLIEEYKKVYLKFVKTIEAKREAYAQAVEFERQEWELREQLNSLSVILTTRGVDLARLEEEIENEIEKLKGGENGELRKSE